MRWCLTFLTLTFLVSSCGKAFKSSAVLEDGEEEPVEKELLPPSCGLTFHTEKTEPPILRINLIYEEIEGQVEPDQAYIQSMPVDLKDGIFRMSYPTTSTQINAYILWMKREIPCKGGNILQEGSSELRDYVLKAEKELAEKSKSSTEPSCRIYAGANHSSIEFTGPLDETNFGDLTLLAGQVAIIPLAHDVKNLYAGLKGKEYSCKESRAPVGFAITAGSLSPDPLTPRADPTSRPPDPTNTSIPEETLVPSSTQTPSADPTGTTTPNPGLADPTPGSTPF